jgi:hypothetical protein
MQRDTAAFIAAQACRSNFGHEGPSKEREEVSRMKGDLVYVSVTSEMFALMFGDVNVVERLR